MCTWPHHRKRYRFDSGKSGNHDWLKKKTLATTWSNKLYLYTIILHGITNIQTLICVDHPTRLVPSDPKSTAVSACRGLGFPVFCGGRGRDGTVERRHRRRGASGIGGFVYSWEDVYICGKYSELWCFFLEKKMGYVMSAIITSHLNPYYSFFVSQNGTNGRRIQ